MLAAEDHARIRSGYPRRRRRQGPDAEGKGGELAQLTGGDSSLLRRINSAVTLHALRGGEALALTQLVGDTGLSRPTVEGVIEATRERPRSGQISPEPTMR